MGQNRKHREWPRPRTTRFVWVSQPGPQVPPIQGYVLDWRRQSYRWPALVATVRLDGSRSVVVQEWVYAERLRPVRSDPNGRQLEEPEVSPRRLSLLCSKPMAEDSGRLTGLEGETPCLGTWLGSSPLGWLLG